MSESTTLPSDLESELRRYFAVTTSTEVPRRVAQMSARTLAAGRPRVAGRLAGATAVLATASLVVVFATRLGSLGGADSGSSKALQPGGASSAQAGYALPAPITYPGVDTGRLAVAGTALLSATGHGVASFSSIQAQGAAVASAGARAGAPGPAVLAFAELTDGTRQSTCLCWIVDVPVRGGVAGGLGGSSSLRTELVLIDALNGAHVTTLTGNGIP